MLQLSQMLSEVLLTREIIFIPDLHTPFTFVRLHTEMPHNQNVRQARLGVEKV